MTVQFPGLAELLGRDPDKVRLVVRVFCRWVAMDLERLEGAAAAQEWQTVRELAQRIHVGCLQVCESGAARAAAELGRVHREQFADAYARHKAVIVDLLDRAEGFVTARIPEATS